MSGAFYPLGMSSYNNRLPQGGYKTWKGTGVSSNPVGVTSGNIRPLTNNDPGNVFPTGFGLARPIKHYRKGTVIPVPVLIEDPANPGNYIEKKQLELIDYNLHRHVKSSVGASLGGGSGGRGMITQLINTPGSFIVKQNPLDEKNGPEQLDKDCKTCQGVGIVADYYPNKTYLTENPEPNTTNFILCCNAEKKALRRVIPASTKLKKNYYTTLQQYRQNRCKTYEQRVFNFERGVNPFPGKPGGPLSLLNTYVANCQPNAELEETSEVNLIGIMVSIMKTENILSPQQIQLFIQLKITTFGEFINYISRLPQPTQKQAADVYDAFVNNPYYGVPITGPTNPAGCKLVVYKPNNYQFAQQGAVSSSTRILKLNVTTIEKNLAGYNRDQKKGIEIGQNQVIGVYPNPDVPYLYKNKSEKCNAQTQTRFQNHKSCSRTDPDGKPSQSAFPTNYYFQNFTM